MVRTEVTKLVAGMLVNALFRDACAVCWRSSTFTLALESTSRAAKATKIETNALSSSLETWARYPVVEGEEAVAIPTKAMRDFACRLKSSLFPMRLIYDLVQQAYIVSPKNVDRIALVSMIADTRRWVSFKMSVRVY